MRGDFYEKSRPLVNVFTDVVDDAILEDDEIEEGLPLCDTDKFLY